MLKRSSSCSTSTPKLLPVLSLLQVEEMLGPKAGAALSIIMYLYLLLSCTAYLIIAIDCLVPLLAGAFGPDAWWAGRQAVAAAVGLGVLLPLSVPRTLGAISRLVGGCGAPTPP